MGKLDQFRAEINVNLACGGLSATDLPVVGADGGHPVVAALEHEPLSTVLGRIRAVGGYANLFVRTESAVRAVAVVDAECAIAPADDEMTAPDDRPSPRSTIGMFLDYVERHPNGVAIDATAVGQSATARSPRVVDFAHG